MIRAQRRRHVIAWLVLAPAIAAVIVLAAIARTDAQRALLGPAPPTTSRGATP